MNARRRPFDGTRAEVSRGHERPSKRATATQELGPNEVAGLVCSRKGCVECPPGSFCRKYNQCLHLYTESVIETTEPLELRPPPRKTDWRFALALFGQSLAAMLAVAIALAVMAYLSPAQ